MPLYDDENARKESERLAEILKKFKRPTQEEMDNIKQSINILGEVIIEFNEKQKYESLTTEENLLLDEISEKMKKFGESISDIKLVLGQKLFGDAMKVMEEYRKAGEAGNVEAQKSYEKLYASWLNTQKPKINQSN